MHNSAQLRQVLIDQLGTRIGTYTWETGTVTPAIAVGNPPNNITVNGLEFILPLLPRVISSVRAGFTMRTEEEYSILIYQHSLGADSYEALFLAVEELLAVFFNATGYDIPQSTIPNSRFGYCLKVKIFNCREIKDISPRTDTWTDQ
jgi:hypothetical protein